MKVLSISKGFTVLLDDEDFAAVSKYSWWTLETQDGKKYAQTRIDGKHIYLHRFIMKAPPKTFVDHRNGNTLDCRKENMRFASRSQNAANAKKHLHSRKLHSLYKGVEHPTPKSKKWRARIAGKHIGCYQTEVEAAQAYDQEAKILWGDFALLNFPKV